MLCRFAGGYRYSIFFFFFYFRLESHNAQIEVTIYLLQQCTMLVTLTHLMQKPAANPVLGQMNKIFQFLRVVA